MKGLRIRLSCALLVVLCTGCPLRKSSPPQQAQAPPLQTGNGTLTPRKTSQPQEKSSSPLASPLPPPSAQTVPLPPPALKKVRHRVKTPKPVEAPPPAVTAPATVATQTVAGQGETASPIGQLTTGDSALGERTKHETADLIGATQQGLNGIKRSLSTDERVTAMQIRTFLKQAQQALESGDADGGHTLATKAKLLLDELIKN